MPAPEPAEEEAAPAVAGGSVDPGVEEEVAGDEMAPAPPPPPPPPPPPSASPPAGGSGAALGGSSLRAFAALAALSLAPSFAALAGLSLAPSFAAPAACAFGSLASCDPGALPSGSGLCLVPCFASFGAETSGSPLGVGAQIVAAAAKSTSARHCTRMRLSVGDYFPEPLRPLPFFSSCRSGAGREINKLRFRRGFLFALAALRIRWRTPHAAGARARSVRACATRRRRTCTPHLCWLGGYK